MPKMNLAEALTLLRSKNTDVEIMASRPSVIFAASYSTKNGTNLAAATEANLRLAIGYQKRFSHKPFLYFGCCSHPYPHAERDELMLKTRILLKEGVGLFSNIGSITSSIDEMLALKKNLAGLELSPGILICTCELHSRAERILAEMIFPGVKILVACNSHEFEVEEDHPTPDQRSWDRWIECSVKRYRAFRFVSWLPRFMHPLCLWALSHIKHKGKE